jgi:hypothetical protein
LRKCSKKYFEKYLYCSPLIINGIISELDGDLNQTNHCSKEMNGIFYKLIRNKNLLDYCKSFCPKDCIFIDYKLINTFVDEKDIRSSHTLYYSSVEPKRGGNISTRLLWDTTSPTLYYIEMPVLSFIEYLCYCGGLFGLWISNDGKLFLYFIPNVFKLKFSSLRNLFHI